MSETLVCDLGVTNVKKIRVDLHLSLDAVSCDGFVRFCLCMCAERWTYSVWTGVARGFQVDLLRDMRFSDKAEIYMTEAGFEAIRGIRMIGADFGTGPEPPFDLADTATRRQCPFA
ncbi:hypothetical protein BH20ACI2_BH20ACI2_00500 [soil metagenome]